jgi:methionine-S-sulfoxide reductase
MSLLNTPALALGVMLMSLLSACSRPPAAPAPTTKTSTTAPAAGASPTTMLSPAAMSTTQVAVGQTPATTAPSSDPQSSAASASASTPAAAGDSELPQDKPSTNPSKPQAQPQSAGKPAPKPAKAYAVIAGGCFWCVEAVFEELEGVLDAESGYSGGTRETANYEDVCSKATGHAEAVRLTFDPSKISYEKLLEVHFATHDPTTLNRQGADKGPQYRSAIFYASEQEKKTAQAVIERVNKSGAFSNPVVTTLEPLKEFYPAERVHQNYVCNNPFNPYVQNVAMPKVEKVRKVYKDLLKKN